MGLNEDIKKIIKRLEDIDSRTRLGPAIELLHDLRLLAGIEDESSLKFFIERLKEAPAQKEQIAKYLTRTAHDSGYPSLIGDALKNPHFFFESGSTIAYVIGEFARILNAKVDPSRFDSQGGAVLTNNLFALTALAGLVEHVAPVWGNLVPKYSGFFPSVENEKHPNNESNDEKRKHRWLREIRGYARLRDDIGECSHILATCSNFSFLAGPLVGSRGNALAKHAIYTGRKPDAEFAVCFHFEKIIALHEDGPANHQLEACYCVFPGLSNDTSDERPISRIRERLNRENWHIVRWLRAAKTAVRELASADREYDRQLDFAAFKSTWAAKARGMRILIGLPPEDNRHNERVKWLRDEVDIANSLISQIHCAKYEFNEEALSKFPGVVEIRVVEPRQT